MSEITLESLTAENSTLKSQVSALTAEISYLESQLSAAPALINDSPHKPLDVRAFFAWSMSRGNARAQGRIARTQKAPPVTSRVRLAMAAAAK